MINTELKSKEDGQQRVDQKIDDLLLDIYTAMPSWGSYPFTIIRIANKDIGGLTIVPGSPTKSRILILERTDFSLNELIDYVTHSKEYRDIRSEFRDEFLQGFMIKYRSPAALKIWKNQVTSLGIGIVIQIARQKGLNVTLVDNDLAQQDFLSEFNFKGLSAYQLLDYSLM